jgi:RNAse (barnase) inhibitor barstar
MASNIILDVTAWKTRKDFYAALLPQLRAPKWHGENLDALWDSIVAGDINELSPPYTISLTGRGPLPGALAVHLAQFLELIAEARAQGVDVSVSVASATGLPSS